MKSDFYYRINAHHPSVLSCNIWFPHSREEFPGNVVDEREKENCVFLPQHVQSRITTESSFHVLFSLPVFHIGFPLSHGSLSVDENVMNENVFYVMLHNIIVFNRQIPLSRHLIFGR